jgi:GNAT superfamily N-acetyltransferase
MKPLLIMPPAAARWPAFETLLTSEEPIWLEDLRRRLSEGLDGAHDAFAIIPEGGRAVAAACLRRRHQVGVLGQLFTHPAHRKRGHARRLVQTLLSWFDMTGGRWLLATASVSLFADFLEHFGFRVLHSGGGTVALERALAGVDGKPAGQGAGETRVAPLGRADWPLLVALQMYCGGADRRVSPWEAALSAERAALELVEQSDRGHCALLGAWYEDRLAGAASVAVDQLGGRTYAMIIPHEGAPQELRAGAIGLARARGYEQVEFPLEAVRGQAGG